MLMGTQGLHAALVLVVPDSQGLVVGTAYDELAAWVEEHSAHPVIMAHLRRTGNTSPTSSNNIPHKHH